MFVCLCLDEGEVWLCGFGEYFSAESQRFFYDPKKIEMPEPVKQISCGQSHNVALSGEFSLVFSVFLFLSFFLLSCSLLFLSVCLILFFLYRV